MKSDSRAERIDKLLREHFAPDLVKIADESAKHHGHAGSHDGGESHYHIIIVSKAFKGMSRVMQHRAVYAALKTEMGEGGIHAIALELRDEL